jgi:hypothetical protein
VTLAVTHALTATELSEDDNNYYNLSASGDAQPDWSAGVPYWEVWFNYTAKQAYADNVVKIDLNLDSANTYATANTDASGDGLLSKDEDGDMDNYACTITLTAGGVTLYEATITEDSDDTNIEAKVDIMLDDLRLAIIDSGDQSFFKLKVTGHDIRAIDMTDSAMFSYNVAKLFSRDDGLYLTAIISLIAAALGIFLVQPKYSLPMGRNTPRRRGY